MAIPACVDPTACGTNVSFSTAGIKIDIELDNVGCGVDLSCSAAGVRADARVLAGGGLACDAGSRSLYVNRRGATAAADPGNCYSRVNIDGSGGLWVPNTLVRNDGLGDMTPINVPATGDPVQVVNLGSIDNDTSCPETWLIKAKCSLNVERQSVGNGCVPPEANFVGHAFACVEMRLRETVTVNDFTTRVTASWDASAGNPSVSQDVWISTVINVPAGGIRTFQARFDTIARSGIRTCLDPVTNNVSIQGLQVIRMFN